MTAPERHGPPPHLHIVTLRCIFGCPTALVESFDPWQAHEAMEAHYRAEHADDIARTAS